MSCLAPHPIDPHGPIRVLVIPGLHDSGPGHWQTWLQSQYQGAVRVVQQDWHRPDLQAWSERIAQTLAQHDPRTRWVAVVHSFGCLALAHHLAHTSRKQGVRTALMVAPASPDKFGIRQLLPQAPLHLPGTLVASTTDPWMSAQEAESWAHTWGLSCRNLGDAGHINAESGYGPWPLARCKVDQMIRELQQSARPTQSPSLQLQVAI